MSGECNQVPRWCRHNDAEWRKHAVTAFLQHILRKEQRGDNLQFSNYGTFLVIALYFSKQVPCPHFIHVAEEDDDCDIDIRKKAS